MTVWHNSVIHYAFGSTLLLIRSLGIPLLDLANRAC